MVLVHGFSSNRYENWKRMGWYDAIAGKGMRGLALDCRGHGESAKPHEPDKYGREAMARDVFALMDHAGVERAHLLGFSMGAHIALDRCDESTAAASIIWSWPASAAASSSRRAIPTAWPRRWKQRRPTRSPIRC